MDLLRLHRRAPRLITAWTVAFGTKESTSALRAKAQKNGNPFEAFKALFQNDQLLWVALSYLLYAIANVITTGVMYYLFVFVLDEPAAFSITGIIPLIAGFIMRRCTRFSTAGFPVATCSPAAWSP